MCVGGGIFIRLTVGENGSTQFTIAKPNHFINYGSVCGVIYNKATRLYSCCNDAWCGRKDVCVQG